MAPDAAASRDILRDMRRDRRAWRVADLDWVDALYKVYLTAVVAILAVSVLSAWVGDDEVGARAADRVAQEGPAALGLVAALAVGVGLRSGERGGPLAVEAADVRHVLLAPVPHAVALRPIALRQLRHAAFVGAAVGAVAGQLTFRRLPGEPAGWIAAGAGYGAAVALGATGAAMVVSGRRLRRPLPSLGALALAVWSVADVASGAVTSPLSVLGRLGVAPLDLHAADAVAAVALVAVAVLGAAWVGGTSLEASERRAALVGQMRFAVTLQDLRTALVLRRQLAQELPRARPWFRVRRGSAVWVRDWRGVARWPASRLVRLVVLGAAAGLAARGAWEGTTPLVAVAGLAMFVAALDTVEPLGQELDHPDRAASAPVVTGSLHLRHLATASVVTALVGAVGLAVAVAIGPDRALALEVGVPTLVTAALGAVLGAAGSAITSDPSGRSEFAIPTPEAMAAAATFRLAWPPATAIVGVLPVVAARAAATSADPSAPPPSTAAVAAGLLALVVIGFVAAWVRFRDDARRWMQQAFGS